MQTLKRIEYETEDGRVTIETWKGSTDKIYTTIDVFGSVALEVVKEAIKFFEGKDNA